MTATTSRSGMMSSKYAVASQNTQHRRLSQSSSLEFRGSPASRRVERTSVNGSHTTTTLHSVPELQTSSQHREIGRATSLRPNGQPKNAASGRFLVLTPNLPPSTSFSVPGLRLRGHTETHKPLETSYENNISSEAGVRDSKANRACRPPASFRDLPNKVLGKIFEALIMKRYQRSFILVNRRTFELLIGPFYNTIRLNLNNLLAMQEAVMKLVASSNATIRTNPGQMYIRRLELFARDVANLDDQVATLAGTLIEGLDLANVEWVSWPIGLSLSASVFWILWNTHTCSVRPRLSNLILTDQVWSDPSTSTKSKTVLTAFIGTAAPYLSHLHISPQSEIGLEELSGVFKRLGSNRARIKSLNLDFRTLVPPMGPGHRRWDGVVEEPLLNMMFKYLGPIQAIRSVPLSNITKLVFKSVNFHVAAEMFERLVPISVLQHLELLRCPFAGRMLSTAIRAATAKLESLKVDHDVADAAFIHDGDPEPPNEISDAVASALSSWCSHLRALWVKVRGHTAGLARDSEQFHWHSLQSLYFDCVAGTSKANTEKMAESRAIVCSLKNTYKPQCSDVGLAIADVAFQNGRQVRKALIEDASIQRGILGHVETRVLTLVIPTRVIAMLYDNPNLRLQHRNQRIHANSDLLEAFLVRAIATATFSIDSNIRKGDITGGEAFQDWTVADSACPATRRGLQLVIIALDPEPSCPQGHLDGAPMTSTAETNGSSTSLPSTDGLAGTSATGIDNQPGSGISDRSAMAVHLQRLKPVRHMFVRGYETMVIDGTLMRRDVAVPAPKTLLEHMGVDVPMYFDGDEE